MPRLLLMFSINAIFSGMTGQSTNAAFSPLIFQTSISVLLRVIAGQPFIALHIAELGITYEPT